MNYGKVKFKYYYVLQNITMKIVSVKFKENVLKEIDTSISRYNFNSRTEFIRAAVRDKLSELTKEELMQEFLKRRGKASRKTTLKDNRKTKEIVGEEMMKELDKKFS
jgi:metal-responsive CopG/Arc/MetJ family transcriptional regulator